MKRTSILITLLFIAFGSAQSMIIYPIPYKDAQKAYDDYVELLRQHDVYVSLPTNHSPSSIRGLSDVKSSIGRGSENISLDCSPVDIGAIVEDDSCKVAICYPQIQIDVPGKSDPYYIWGVRGSRGIESDLRMIYDDMHLDVRPMVRIIAEEDMSGYANADTVALYEFDLGRNRFMDTYTQGVGIYLRKKDHPAMLLRLMLTSSSVKEKDRYIREVLDNIRFGDNPSDTFVELEKQESGRSDFSFPSKYRMFTGILPDINDETLDEINRVKAWCEAHGMKELPQIDDAVLDALNRARKSRDKHKAEADSILSEDNPDEEKILMPYMCDTHAHFPGKDEADGNRKYWEWLRKNLRYPNEAVKKGIEGVVWVSFVVKADGSIGDVAIDKMSMNSDPSLKKEALRLIRSMPRWNPAIYDGKAENSRNSCLVRFDLPKRKSEDERTEPTAGSIAEEHIYDMTGVPVAPKFNGGYESLQDWIQDHIHYPSDAAKAKIEGRVIVEFIIDKDGGIVSPKVIRGINDSLDNEALRIIKSAPKWTPGYSGGKAVKTRYTCPVTFRLAKAK